ncbi:MAG: hypothetical protein KJO82_04355 [Gammaproteobacteria bacterium]|nr:hypothetical protein [Gammaproteobacteria bacterium]
MDFRGLLPADLAEVRSLNSAFLACLRSEPRARRWRDALPAEQQPLIDGLSDLQRERLAGTPFLLFSMRESDAEFWLPRFASSSTGDLFDVNPADDTPCERLACAALSFLWALARQNSYAARLVSGAPLHWCDLLAEQALLPLLQVAGYSDLVRPRLAGRSGFWRRLLQHGLASDGAVRGAAQLAAMQTVLTRQHAEPQPSMRAAACRTRLPALQRNEV